MKPSLTTSNKDSSYTSIETSATGIYFNYDIALAQKPGMPLSVSHDPTNGHDPNALLVRTKDNEVLGFIPRDDTEAILDTFGTSLHVVAFVTPQPEPLRHEPRPGAELEIWLPGSAHLVPNDPLLEPYHLDLALKFQAFKCAADTKPYLERIDFVKKLYTMTTEEQNVVFSLLDAWQSPLIDVFEHVNSILH